MTLPTTMSPIVGLTDHLPRRGRRTYRRIVGASRSMESLPRRHRTLGRVSVVVVGGLLVASMGATAPVGAAPQQEMPAPMPQSPAGFVGQAPTATSDPACVTEPSQTELYVRCVLSDTSTSVDLASIPAASGADAIWIQAWGGQGSSTPLENGAIGTAGERGFAQSLTTLSDYESTFGTTMLYYLLGDVGTFVGQSDGFAGSGGASTLVSAVPPTNTLDTASDVVVVAGGGGGGAVFCIEEPPPGSPPDCTGADGGAAGVAMSNDGAEQRQAQAGQNGGAAGNGGTGGAAGDGGTAGVNGVGGAGGGIVSTTADGFTVSLPPTGWVNDSTAVQTLTAGSGAERGCEGTGFIPPACMRGGGGGGWGGGAAGFYVQDIRASGGGGGGSFAAPSTASDSNAPTQAPAGPADGVGEVHLVFRIPLDFQRTFCSEQTLGGQEGFLCEVPFNWVFEVPEEFVGDDWLVTMTAQGGRGGNGSAAGLAQTTRTTGSLAGKTLYAWVGAAGEVSSTYGGGGGGASALMTTPDPFSAISRGLGPTTISDDFLLVAGGSGGGMGLGACTDPSGEGGVAIATGPDPATGSGENGQPFDFGQSDFRGGTGALFTNNVWTAGIPGVGAGLPGQPGTPWLTFVGGPGGDGGPVVGTVPTAVLGAPVSSPPAENGGPGGSGYCHGGGGGAGAASAGGGAGGSSDGGLISTVVPGGTGGGGGSMTAGIDIDPSKLPTFAGQPLAPRDRTQGSVSLFFYQSGGSGPPPVPADGATIDDVQPTLGYDGTSNEPVTYRISESGAATPTVVSSPTPIEIWTVPIDGALQPGTTYQWDVVDGDGNSLQAPRSFTVNAAVTEGDGGVRVEMRSMNWFATQPGANAPAYLIPESGQAVPRATSDIVEGCPENAPPSCTGQWSGTVDDPDDYGTYFTTDTAVQATTFQPSINFDWANHDPFGLGLSELFTLRVTGALTVPVSGEYTFAVNTSGGARLTLNDPSGSPLGGGPQVDTWGQITSACFAEFPEAGNEDYSQVVIFLASLACVNSDGPTSGQPVALEAGVAYPFEMDGFMSWRPGPFQLLYSQAFFGDSLAPVPGSWLTTDCPNCPGTAEPPPPPSEPSPGELPPWVTFPSERLVDTRPGLTTIDGVAAGGGGNAAGAVLEFPVAGRGSVPTEVGGVLTNVTVTGAEGPGFATVFDCGTRPNASTLNFQTGASVANGAVSALSSSGSLCVYTNRAADVVVDIGGFVPVTSPVVVSSAERMLETRPGLDTVDGDFAGTGSNSAGETIEVQIAGRGSVPDDAAGVFANVTITGADGPGFATVWACGTQPETSSSNYQASRSVANNAVVGLSPSGSLCVFTQRNADVVVDVTGHIPAGVDAVSSFAPERFADTRPASSTIDSAAVGGGPVAAGASLEVPVAGRGSVPDDAVTVAANVTITGAEAAGYATVHDCGVLPATSTLNFQPGESIANTQIVSLSSTGTICVYLNQTADVVIDVTAATTADASA